MGLTAASTNHEGACISILGGIPDDADAMAKRDLIITGNVGFAKRGNNQQQVVFFRGHRTPHWRTRKS